MSATNFSALWQRLFGHTPEVKEVNPNKFCFITCVNNEQVYQRSLSTIQFLQIPPGYSVETYAVRGASGLTQAYNEALLNTDAKYKIYLHQDVFIIHPGFLFEILRLFQLNPRVGMLGAVGFEFISANGIWWEVPGQYLYGQVFWEHPNFQRPLVFQNPKGPYQRVRGIDGLIMMTQYDIPWRSDLFQGFHFYDLSQSLEFTKLGFEVGVPLQARPWFIHASNSSTSPAFWQAHAQFMQEYRHFIGIGR